MFVRAAHTYLLRTRAHAVVQRAALEGKFLADADGDAHRVRVCGANGGGLKPLHWRPGVPRKAREISQHIEGAQHQLDVTLIDEAAEEMVRKRYVTCTVCVAYRSIAACGVSLRSLNRPMGAWTPATKDW